MKWRNVARHIKQPIKWQNNSAMQPKHSGYPTKQPGFFSSNQVGFNKKVASHYCVRQPFRYSIWSLIQYRSSVSSFVPSAIPMNISASSFCSNWNWYPFHLSSSCVTMAPIRMRKIWIQISWSVIRFCPRAKSDGRINNTKMHGESITQNNRRTISRLYGMQMLGW